MKHHEQVPWQSLGFEENDLNAIRDNLSRGLDRWWDGPPQAADQVPWWISDVSRNAGAVLTMNLLQYHGYSPPLNAAAEVAHRLVGGVVYFFFGPWRQRFRLLTEEYDATKARAKLEWIDYYREGLAIALSLSDWDSTEQLLQWPGCDLPVDEGLTDRTPADNAYQIWLAGQLRGEPELLPNEKRELVEFRARRLPKLLFASADALLSGDVDGFSQNLTKYLRLYRQRKFDASNIHDGIALDATALWHLARRRGLGEVELPWDLMILIARP